MIFTSIRWRLQAWHGALLTAVVVGFGFTAHRLATGNRLRQIDEELQAHSTQLGIAVPPASDAEPPRPASRRPPPRDGGSLTDQITAGGAYFVVWQADGKVQTRSANAPDDLVPPAHVSGDELHTMRTRGSSREFIRFTKVDRCFLVGRDISAELAELRHLSWYLAGAGTGLLICSLLIGWCLSTRALRPIENISVAAEKIAAGDLSHRIEASGFADELQRLAGVLNSTFSRLDAAFTQQGRFTADAAHELRTPVSVILIHAQNGLASDHLTDEQREAFESCQRAAQRMRGLIESLLELARFEAGQETLRRVPFDLSVAVCECVELLKPMADEHRVQLICEGTEVKCLGDPDRIAQVITNLLVNAIDYNHAGGQVRLSAQRQNGHAILTVTDNGQGIPAEDLPHIFERFYRADAARSNGAKRNGLGLAICKAIVESHGGSITAASRPGEGAEFIVQLPVPHE